jgi:hypothetical protein
VGDAPQRAGFPIDWSRLACRLMHRRAFAYYLLLSNVFSHAPWSAVGERVACRSCTSAVGRPRTSNGALKSLEISAPRNLNWYTLSVSLPLAAAGAVNLSRGGAATYNASNERVRKKDIDGPGRAQGLLFLLDAGHSEETQPSVPAWGLKITPIYLFMFMLCQLPRFILRFLIVSGCLGQKVSSANFCT